MIELQIINKILSTKDISFLTSKGVMANDFSDAYKGEIEFIYNHINTYNMIPDELTFFNNFPNCDVIEVNEGTDYLLDRFIDDLIYRKEIEIANEWGQKLRDSDAHNSLEFLVSKVEEVRRIEYKKTQGVNIINDKERLELYEKMTENEEIMGIKTGIKDLDNIIHSIQPTDLTVLAARTNQGKSFLSLKLATNIWEQGHSVLYYSGELNATPMGYRFDTLLSNFSNTGLTTGEVNLGAGKTMEDYKKYMEDLSTKDNEFNVVTPTDLGKKQLDVPTLRFLIDKYQPKFVVLDQLSLMNDARKGRVDSERQKYSHIMEDLRILVNEKEIPILVTSQTNRNSAVKSHGITEPPNLGDLSESDGVAHHATKVFMFIVNNDILNFMVRKNTNGEKDRGFKMIWNKDFGLFREFTNPEEDEEKEQKEGADVF